MSARTRDFVLIAIALLLAAAPVAYAALRSLPTAGSVVAVEQRPGFKGTDDQAKSTIAALVPGYRPWFSSVWTPPSKGTERALFGLQAAIGASFIGYYVVSRRRRFAQRATARKGSADEC